jgi:hypothetical protein
LFLKKENLFCCVHLNVAGELIPFQMNPLYNRGMCTEPAYPAYLSHLQSGELARRVEQAYTMLESCRLCAHGCKINRRAGKLGVCRTGEQARVADYHPHHGEERPLSGTRGSGAVFFSRCNLRLLPECRYQPGRPGERHRSRGAGEDFSRSAERRLL